MFESIEYLPYSIMSLDKDTVYNVALCRLIEIIN